MPTEDDIIRVEVDEKTFSFERRPDGYFILRFGRVQSENKDCRNPLEAAVPDDIVRQMAALLPEASN